MGLGKGLEPFNVRRVMPRLAAPSSILSTRPAHIMFGGDLLITPPHLFLVRQIWL